jgi:hypothetical protein
MTNLLNHTCSDCANWRADVDNEFRSIKDLSDSPGHGLCRGGIFSNTKTQFDETCSMWRTNMDKERIAPIFFEN